MLPFVPNSIKIAAVQYLVDRGFIRNPLGTVGLRTVMTRRKDLKIATVIDIGASDGRWSEEMMKHLPAAKYLLVEAQASAHAAALQRFKAKHPGVEYEICAAGDREGEVFFDVSDPWGGQASDTAHSQNSVRVPTKTVDDLVRRHAMTGPYLLKLDTHGFEAPIFEGARETLREVAMLIVEAYNFTLQSGAMRFHELCAFLEARGFRCVDMFDLMVRPGDEAFWQMDMVFLRSEHPIFQSNEYASRKNHTRDGR